MARLLPNGARRRGGVLTGSWHGWLVRPQQWLQPRVIPLIAAVVGLIAMLSAQSYLLALARGPEPTVEPAAPEASPAGPATQPPLAPPGLPERLPPSGR